MKLAFVINVFREDDFHSGGEKLFYELVNRATDDGYKVDLYCTSYLGTREVLKNRLNRLTLLGLPKDFKYPHKIEAFYSKVKELAEKENYDYIISENISPVIDPDKHIGVLQGHSQAHYRSKAGNFLERALFGIKKHRHISAQKEWLKTPYRKIIVPSIVLKDELMRNFRISEDKFLVMYPGVEVPARPTPARIEGEPFTFGLSAPSFGKKGGYVFLQALNQLKRRGYDFRAKVIYPKHAKNFGLQFALAWYGLRNVVEFMPYQEDMSGFYSSVDCVVMPSIMETFGLVALEGMINGKPAIVSSFCGAKEVITNGENGFVFDMEHNIPCINVEPKQTIVDWTNKFNKNITSSDLKDYINKLAESGNAIPTLSKDWYIDIINRAKIKRHILVSSKINRMSDAQKRRHNKYISGIEELIRNAEYSSDNQNNKKDKKPNVEKYHYFTTNVKISDKIYSVILVAEQFKGEKEIKPQTVHLYDVIENKTSSQGSRHISAGKQPYEDANNNITYNQPNFNPNTQTAYHSLADRMELLLKNFVAQPINIKMDNIPKFKKVAELKNWIVDNLNLIGDITVASNRRTIRFSKDSIGRSLKGVNRNKVRNQSYSGLRNLVEKSVYGGQKAADEKHKKSIKGQELYYNAMIYNNQLYGVEISVDIPVNKHFLHSYAGHKIKLIKIAPDVNGLTSQGKVSDITNANNNITDIIKIFNPEATLLYSVSRHSSDRYAAISQRAYKKACTFSWEAFYERFKTQVLMS